MAFRYSTVSSIADLATFVRGAPRPDAFARANAFTLVKPGVASSTRTPCTAIPSVRLRRDSMNDHSFSHSDHLTAYATSTPSTVALRISTFPGSVAIPAAPRTLLELQKGTRNPHSYAGGHLTHT